MFKFFKTIFTIICAVFLTTAIPTLAAEESSDWEAQVRKTDDAYWYEFNFGTSAALNSYLAADVEFYHDLGGTVIGWDALAKVNAGMDGTVNRARRIVVPGSLRIFPMRRGNDVYGAIVSGDHQFYSTKAGDIVKKNFRSSFTHLMLLKDGIWKIARIYSYDHQRVVETEK